MQHGKKEPVDASITEDVFNRGSNCAINFKGFSVELFFEASTVSVEFLLPLIWKSWESKIFSRK